MNTNNSHAYKTSHQFETQKDIDLTYSNIVVSQSKILEDDNARTLVVTDSNTLPAPVEDYWRSFQDICTNEKFLKIHKKTSMASLLCAYCNRYKCKNDRCYDYIDQTKGTTVDDEGIRTQRTCYAPSFYLGTSWLEIFKPQIVTWKFYNFWTDLFHVTPLTPEEAKLLDYEESQGRTAKYYSDEFRTNPTSITDDKREGLVYVYQPRENRDEIVYFIKLYRQRATEEKYASFKVKDGSINVPYIFILIDSGAEVHLSMLYSESLKRLMKSHYYFHNKEIYFHDRNYWEDLPEEEMTREELENFVEFFFKISKRKFKEMIETAIKDGHILKTSKGFGKDRKVTYRVNHPPREKCTSKVQNFPYI